MASEIEKNKSVTAPHEYLTEYWWHIILVTVHILPIPCVIRLLSSACFCTLYAHTYLTLLIYIAGDFVYYTSVSDIVWRWFCMPAITLLYTMYINLMSDYFYWFEFVRDCTLHFLVITFFKEALEFIDIISLISRSRPALLQHCKLAWWRPGNETISIMYTCEPSWVKACVALQLSLCSMRK